jgi:MoaA/NifB/PqqE/SkfB family radical SAM enzyme
LRSLSWEGEGDRLAVVRTLRRIASALLRAPRADAPTFAAGETASEEVRAIAAYVGRIELGAFALVRERASDDERLRRRVDDAERTLLFRALADARRDGTERAREEPRVLERAAQRLGPAGAWVRSFRRASEGRTPRLVVIPTWQCELRCRYCTIPKQDGRVMSRRTLERTIDLLLSADAPHVDLHFFGGEPFTEFELLRHAVVWGTARAAEEGRTIRFLFTTNGWELTEEQLAFLARYDVWFQLSLDGDRETQEESRPARDHGSSYDRSPGGKAAFILASKVDHDVVQVVHPRNATRMARNFRHIVDLGYRRVQLNYALGTWWEPPSIAAWAEGLMEIGREVKARAEAGDPVELVNLEETLLTVRGSLELTIDWDGTVFGSTAFLVLPKKRDKFVLGHLDQARSFDHYVHDAFPMEHLLANWFGEGMAENNHAVGSVLTSFVRWWRANVPGVGMRPGRGPGGPRVAP